MENWHLVRINFKVNFQLEILPPRSIFEILDVILSKILKPKENCRGTTFEYEMNRIEG